MSIQVLDQITVDKIAAGEVVERPASVVKELVENAIDAKATSVTIEIKDGGISFLRVSDNGLGIPYDQVGSAFLRHSTSKIKTAEDLDSIQSLGFRGEALSSIAAVAQIELITKPHNSESGCKYRIEGGVEKQYEEVGAPDGTTFLVHQIFYNTPARRKFLKTPMTEASHIGELLNRLALSHPEISFQFINNGQSKLHTAGNGNLKDVIYHIYGREIANNLLEISFERNGININGYLGNPSISRGNRNYENYFINGRYVKNNTIYKAIEDAYKDFSMRNRYPFVVLQIDIDGNKVDVNVHPTKMELRFANQQEMYNVVYEALCTTLYKKETVLAVSLPEQDIKPVKSPQPSNEPDVDYFIERMKERVTSHHAQASTTEAIYNPAPQSQPIKEEQLSFFQEDKFLKSDLPAYTIIGQVFETYWLVQVGEQLYIIDQHAAHERVLYEQTLRGMSTREYTTQYIEPPIILNLSMQENATLTEHMSTFERIGFEIEAFGGDSYVVRGIPDNLFHIAKKELLVEMLDDLHEEVKGATTTNMIDEKIASMSCKAAVKGQSRTSFAEMDKLLHELLKLENPYHCPHGRPVIISMSKKELEKKFKRIV